MNRTLREWMEEDPQERTVSALMRGTGIAWATAVNAARGRVVSKATTEKIRAYVGEDVRLGWAESGGSSKCAES